MNRRAAYFAAFRYVMQAVLTAFAVWLQQVGRDGWSALTSFDYWFVGTALGIAALNALGAVMNKRFGEAETRQDAANTATLPTPEEGNSSHGPTS